MRTGPISYQAAYELLRAQGYEPVPGSSRFQNAAGQTGRIVEAPGRGDTWFAEYEADPERFYCRFCGLDTTDFAGECPRCEQDRVAMETNGSESRLIAYWADDRGWHKQRTNDPSDLLRTLHATGRAVGKVTHWAIAAADRDDGGMTPPPGVEVHEESAFESNGSPSFERGFESGAADRATGQVRQLCTTGTGVRPPVVKRHDRDFYHGYKAAAEGARSEPAAYLQYRAKHRGRPVAQASHAANGKRPFRIGQDVQMITSPTFGHVVGFDPDGSVMVQWSGGTVVTGVSPDNLRGLPPGYAGVAPGQHKPNAGAAKVVSAEQATDLPDGSLLWADDRGWVVVPGGLAPITLLTERAGGPVPAGQAAATIAANFEMVRAGTGKVPTYGTAERHVIKWYEGRRQARNGLGPEHHESETWSGPGNYGLTDAEVSRAAGRIARSDDWFARWQRAVERQSSSEMGDLVAMASGAPVANVDAQAIREVEQAIALLRRDHARNPAHLKLDGNFSFGIGTDGQQMKRNAGDPVYERDLQDLIRASGGSVERAIELCERYSVYDGPDPSGPAAQASEWFVRAAEKLREKLAGGDQMRSNASRYSDAQWDTAREYARRVLYGDLSVSGTSPGHLVQRLGMPRDLAETIWSKHFKYQDPFLHSKYSSRQDSPVDLEQDIVPSVERFAKVLVKYIPAEQSGHARNAALTEGTCEMCEQPIEIVTATGQAYHVAPDGSQDHAADADHRPYEGALAANGMTVVDPVEGTSIGISGPHLNQEKPWLALTTVDSKWFKTFAGAKQWLARRGYDEHGRRLPSGSSGGMAPNWRLMLDLPGVERRLGAEEISRVLSQPNPAGYAKARAAAWWDANDPERFEAYTSLARLIDDGDLDDLIAEARKSR